MKVILVWLLAVTLRTIQSQRTPNSIFEFNFLYSQCSPNNFTDSSTNIFGNLEKKNITLGCLNSNGLKSGTFVSSERNVSSLSKKLGNDSYTIELWIQPQFKSFSSPLLSIGSDTGVIQNQCQNNFKIAQSSKDSNAKNVTINFSMQQCRWTTRYNQLLIGDQIWGSTWNTIPVYDGVPAIIHVVISVEVKYQLRYANYPNSMTKYLVATFSINGGASGEDRVDVDGIMYDYTARAWDRSKHLMLMDTYSGGDKWGGNVYYLALYNRVLTAAEITQNYQAGLPNNPQWVRNETVHIRQNGEVGDHNATPEYYLKPIPYYELAVITLPIDDLDDQRISPNYNPAVGATAQVYLTALPAKGQLYYMDGTEIKASKSTGAVSIKLPYDRTTYSFAVRYRPPLNQYSKTNILHSSEVFSTLSFYVIEGGTNIRSSTHTVSIVVTRVNQPPVATPAAQTIFAGKTYILTVEGTDSDTIPIQNDIANAIVTAVPTQGAMYRLDGNGVIQKNIPITAGMDLGVNLKVAYIYTGPQALVWGGSLPFVGSDQFTFTLKDLKGQLSAPATFKLTINAAISATPLAASSAVQRQSTDIPLSITDNGDVKHRLCVKIIRLPLHGELIGSGGDALSAGDLIQSTIYQPVKTSEYVKSYSDASITYRSDENYFNFPRTSLNGTVISGGPDSFEYSICALDIYSVNVKCTAESAKVTQQVNVKNRNRETKVFFDTPSAGGSDMLTVKAVKGHKGSMEDGTMTTLSGFRLVDDDKGIDKIRATVKTTVGGRVALNPTAHTEVDLKCAPAQSAWKCEGDGEGDAVVTFVGSSYAVQRALNGMTYYSETQKTTDTISVTLYDGVGSDCLSEASQGTNSYRDECFTTSVVVSVEVLAYADSSDDKSAMFSTTMQIIGLVVIILVTVSCAYCGWSWCQEKYAEKEDWRSRNKKRAAIAARKEKRAAKRAAKNEERRARKLQKQNNQARAAGRSKRSGQRDYYSDDSVDDGSSGDEQEYDEEYGEESSVDDIEMQRMEAAARRVQKENKRNAQAVKKDQLRLAVAQQQKKLDEVTEEIVQLEEQYPDYSSPPRSPSPSRSHRHTPPPVGSDGRSHVSGSGFRSQTEYDRHMAMAAHQMRAASPTRHQSSSPYRNYSPSSPHQQRSPPRRAPSSEPYMTPPRGHRGGSSSRAYNVDVPRFYE